MQALADRGFRPVGVELVEKAVDDFFIDRGVDFTSDGAVRRGDGVEILVGDIFEVDFGEVDAIWDRASMVALPPDVRGPYVTRMLEWMRPGAVMLLVTFNYDEDEMEGPPFAVPDDEVRAHYDGHGELVRLRQAPIAGHPKAVRGVSFTESVWRFTRR